MFYHFKAKSFSGEIKEGFREARDERELAKILHNEGFSLYFFEPAEAKNAGSKIDLWLSQFQKVSLTDKLMFTQNLSVMISAGLPLARAIEALQKQTKNVHFKQTLSQIAADIRSGQNFSSALAKHPKIFDELFTGMIASAEAAGNTDEVLKTLTKQLKRDYELVSRIKGAMIYPSVIIFVMIIIGIIMMVTVVPTLTSFFKEMKAELPMSTKLVMAMSDFMQNYWYLAILGIAALVYAFRLFLKTRIGKNSFDFVILKLPVFSKLSQKVNIARFARTISSLIEGGVPLTRALEITARTMTNHYYKDSLLATVKEVEKGRGIAQSIEKYEKIYPAVVAQMIRVGEETGRLSEIMNKLASFYEEAVSEATKNMSSIIEPVLMVLIGIVVGFFAVSMIKPMYMIIGSS